MPAPPISFEGRELELLQQEEGKVHHISKLIWTKVVNEQLMGPSRETRPNSRSILSYLLLPPINPQNEIKDNCKENFNYSDDDAALVSSIDAVLSHCSKSKHRVNIMNNWGALMRKGEKLCISLYRWAKYMRLTQTFSERELCRVDFEEEEGKERSKPVVCWDAENELEFTVGRTLSPGTEFVLQVMRLLASRWREHDIKDKISRERRKRKKQCSENKTQKKSKI